MVDSRYLTFDIPNCFDCIRKNLHDKNAKIKCCIESREDLYGKVLNEEINSYIKNRVEYLQEYINGKDDFYKKIRAARAKDSADKNN